jgi:hypothetical protein
MVNESPEDVVMRLLVALRKNQAIEYGAGMKDKEVPEITWARFGLFESNEIVVTATVGVLCLGNSGPSSLIYPAMIDRIFGPDVEDVELASQLADQLWTAHSDRLIAEALRIRQLR